MTTPKPA
jgi:periodic tryptophan protein 2